MNSNSMHLVPHILHHEQTQRPQLSEDPVNACNGGISQSVEGFISNPKLV